MNVRAYFEGEYLKDRRIDRHGKESRSMDSDQHDISKPHIRGHINNRLCLSAENKARWSGEALLWRKLYC